LHQYHRRRSYIHRWFSVGIKRLRLVPIGVIPGRERRSVVTRTAVARMVRKGAVRKTRSATKARPIATRHGSTATRKSTACPLGLPRYGNQDGYRQQSEQDATVHTYYDDPIAVEMQRILFPAPRTRFRPLRPGQHALPRQRDDCASGESLLLKELWRARLTDRSRGQASTSRRTTMMGLLDSPALTAV